MIIDDKDPAENGVYAISIVSEPAIESNFVALGKQVMFKAIDKERRMVVGLALTPEKPILRRREDGTEFMIWFSDQTIRKTAELFMKAANQNNTTIEHMSPVKGCTVIESWIVEDPNNDKLNALGIECKKGAWAIAMKIDNDEIWTDFVKTGVLNGFSIEGMYASGEVVEAKSQVVKKKHSAAVVSFKMQQK